jgi:hypothetical protein
MNRRVQFAVALYLLVTQKILGHVIRWVAGPNGVADVMRGLLEVQRGAIEKLPNVMASKGLARESSELIANVDRVAANLKPDFQWTFHKAQWGDIEVTVMPRVIDSNTGVVIGPVGHTLLGSVVTNDHCAPNCEPSALYPILNGPGVAA